MSDNNLAAADRGVDNVLAARPASFHDNAVLLHAAHRLSVFLSISLPVETLLCG